MFYYLARNTFISLILIVVSLYSFYLSGFRINISESMPVGIWLIEARKRALKRGDIVWFCPPNTTLFQMAKKRGYIPSGSCSGGYAHLIKQISALPGDDVKVSTQGIIVNGRLQPKSHSLSHDWNENLLPSMLVGQVRGKPGQIFVLGVHPNSFDSRYFGWLSTSRIAHFAIPFFVLNR